MDSGRFNAFAIAGIVLPNLCAPIICPRSYRFNSLQTATFSDIGAKGRRLRSMMVDVDLCLLHENVNFRVLSELHEDLPSVTVALP